MSQIGKIVFVLAIYEDQFCACHSMLEGIAPTDRFPCFGAWTGATLGITAVGGDLECSCHTFCLTTDI
jgi:hypothetical protein